MGTHTHWLDDPPGWPGIPLAQLCVWRCQRPPALSAGLGGTSRTGLVANESLSLFIVFQDVFDCLRALSSLKQAGIVRDCVAAALPCATRRQLKRERIY